MGHGFHCLPEPRIWRGGSRRSDFTGPDLYASGTPNFRERNRVTSRKIAQGMVREDIGEPIRTVSGEAPAVPVVTPDLPEDDPRDTEPDPAPVYVPRALSSIDLTDWRADYGLAKSR